MRNLSFIGILFFLVLAFTSCTLVEKTVKISEETTKILWGSSTRALEDARADAMTQKFNCSYDACFEFVLGLERHGPRPQAKSPFADSDAETEEKAKKDETEENPDELFVPGIFEIFLKNRVKRHMVVIGVEGSVDTTEVGIFFVPLSPQVTKIEVSSLSVSAKRKVAEAVFAALNERFAAP